MSRCVPNRDLNDDDAPAAASPCLSFLGTNLPSVDSEVTEFTWENGQLSLHGLGQPRLKSKMEATAGTLESLVNQTPVAAGNQAVPISDCKPFSACAADLIPWFEPSQAPTDVVAAAPGAMMMDALVPCVSVEADDPRRHAIWLLADSAGHGDRIEWRDHQSAIGSSTFSHHVTSLDAYEHERELDNATSEESPENTQPGKVGGGRVADTTTEEHDSVYSRPRRKEEEKRRIGKSSLSTKRSRATTIHNQSERKRRDKINQKLKKLQKLVPNFSKTDMASVIDEVIDYLKQLQAQVQLMSTMNMMPPPMLLPLALQQQLQMSMMAAPMLGLGLAAGMPGIMAGDMSAALGVACRPNIPVIPHVPAFLQPFMPMASWDRTLGARLAPAASGPAPVMPDLLSAFLASQSSRDFDMQAMALDAYSRLAAIYQQQQHQHPQNPNN